MNGMINSNTENNERGLLPYPIILATNKGEPEAMKVVVLHYGSYMTSLSMRKLRDERGNTYWGIDEDTRERLRAKRVLTCSRSFQGWQVLHYHHMSIS
ncbi:helix-turn-helix domain-containing protein [Shouchella clausii]|uniref:helix-turn-helix domain-containing protein n=1 Tax=Shouchella clausii TaxID=79880 RepID=UPI0039832D5B